MTWWELARRQQGVISREQLLAHDVSAATIGRLCSSEHLDAVTPAVYLVRGAPLTYRARLWVAVVRTGAAIAFATAAHLWGVENDPADRIHIVIGRDERRRVPGWVRVHRSDLIPHTIDRSGLPITPRGWTVMDHASTLTKSRASTLLDRALQRGWLEPDELAQHLRQFPYRRGNTLLRELAEQLTDGAAAESERLLHRLLRRAGLTGWSPNYPVWADCELVAVIDVALPARKLAIEIDGMAWHTDVERFQRDRSRQNQLVALGWTVLRFTWADLTERPGYVMSSIRRQTA